jgi:hypothetical protein
MFGFFAVAAVGSLLMRHAYARQRPMIEGNL